MQQPANLVEDTATLYIAYILVDDVFEHLLERNAQEHDTDQLMASMALHGFRDPPAYDATVESIIEGNGRTEALKIMQDEGLTRPKYIRITEDNLWAMPILFGADSTSYAMAMKYSIDHNLTTLGGGDYSTGDKAKMMDMAILLPLLDEIGPTLTVTASEMAYLNDMNDDGDLGDGLEFEDEPEKPPSEDVTVRLKMTVSQKEMYDSLMVAVREEAQTTDDATAIIWLLESN